MFGCARYDNQASLWHAKRCRGQPREAKRNAAIQDTHLVKLELLSNATAIDNALNYIRGKQQEQQEQESLDASSSNNNNDDADDDSSSKQTIF
jgi:hypothetical protein